MDTYGYKQNFQNLSTEEKERRKEPIQNLSTLFDPRIREKHEKMAKCRMTGILILEKKKAKKHPPPTPPPPPLPPRPPSTVG